MINGAIMNYDLFMYFMLFIFYSVVGWIIEVIYTFIVDKKIVNRGFLIGPYCPIYGVGCLLIIILLKKYTDDFIVLFIMSMLICSVLEYLTSYIMEKLFNARWWNYSNRKFNINGRVCLETLIPFGIFGSFILLVVNPFVVSIFSKIPNNIFKVIAILIFIIFVIDEVVSYIIINKLNISTSEITIDNTEEITQKVKEYISKNSKLGKRLMKSFPDLKIKQLKKSKNKKV